MPSPPQKSHERSSTEPRQHPLPANEISPHKILPDSLLLLPPSTLTTTAAFLCSQTDTQTRVSPPPSHGAGVYANEKFGVIFTTHTPHATFTGRHVCTAREGPPRKRTQLGIRNAGGTRDLSSLSLFGEDGGEGERSFFILWESRCEDCVPFFFLPLFFGGWGGGRGDTLVQYAACLVGSFLFERRGRDGGIIRFRLLWWGGCFNLSFLQVCGLFFFFFFFFFPLRRVGLERSELGYY